MIKLKDLLLEDRFTVEFDIGSQGSMSKTVDAKNSKEAAKKVAAGIRGKVKIKKVSKVVDEGKLKLTKDKPKKITQRIWSAPKRIMSKRAYLRMPDINKKRRNGVDYVATSIGPKKTQVYLPVIFESINEAPAQNIKDQYVGNARVKVEPNTYKKQIRNFHDVSMYRDHRKPYNYYLSIRLAHNKTNKVDMIISTGTHIL